MKTFWGDPISPPFIPPKKPDHIFDSRKVKLGDKVWVRWAKQHNPELTGWGKVTSVGKKIGNDQDDLEITIENQGGGYWCDRWGRFGGFGSEEDIRVAQVYHTKPLEEV